MIVNGQDPVLAIPPNIQQNSSHNFGRRGEQAAADWYQNAGYRILDRNWRCVAGEIDLIVATSDAVIFVEVKARSSGRYGSGFDAVDWRKQRRLRQVARAWLSEQREPDGNRPKSYFVDVQFDVVDVGRDGTVQVRHQCF